MRLTCPNCGAQYEVPNEVIPETGRDVQCSNCGDTWFQHHPDHIPPEGRPSSDDTEHADAPPEDDTATRDPDAGADYDAIPDEQGDHPPEIDGTEQPSQDAPDLEEDNGETGDTDDQIQDQPSESATRRALDPAIRDLLREEAEREQHARATDSGGLETQTEMGLDDGGEDQRTREARERMARLRGLNPEQTSPQPSQPADTVPDVPDSLVDDNGSDTDIDPESRRNLLPDIDDINSSLDSHPTPRPETAIARDAAQQTDPKKSGGFRRGVVLSVLLFAGLTLVYVFAPQIADLHPVLDGPMASYVTAVDTLRGLLNGVVASILG